MPAFKERTLVSYCTLNDSFPSPLLTSQRHSIMVAKIGAICHQVRDSSTCLSLTPKLRSKHNELTRSRYKSIADSAEVAAYRAQLIAAKFPDTALAQVALQTAIANLDLSAYLSRESLTTTSSGSPATHRLRLPDVSYAQCVAPTSGSNPPSSGFSLSPAIITCWMKG